MPEASDVLTFAEGNNQVIARDPAAVGTLASSCTLTVTVMASDTGSLSEVDFLSGADLLKTGSDTAIVTETQTRLWVNEPLDGGTVSELGVVDEIFGRDTFTLSEVVGVIGAGFGPTASDAFTFTDGYDLNPLVWDQGNWDEHVWAFSASDLLAVIIDADTVALDTVTLVGLGTVTVATMSVDTATLVDAGWLDKTRTKIDEVWLTTESASISAIKTANDLFALSVEDTSLAGAGDFVGTFEDVVFTDGRATDALVWGQGNWDEQAWGHPATLVTITVITSASDVATLADTGRQLGGIVIDKIASDSAALVESVGAVASAVASDTASLVDVGAFGLTGHLKGRPSIDPHLDGSVSIRIDPRFDGAVTFTP